MLRWCSRRGWENTMHHYQILPLAHPGHRTDVAAGDASAVLNMVQRLGCREADILKDGTYSFSVRLDSNGLWCIFGREEEGAADVVPLFG